MAVESHETPPAPADDMVWLRAVARRVARDASEADDLAQDAWLAAQQAHTSGTRSRRAWLGGVLRNRERMLRRGEARRRRRESASADAATSEDAEVALHRHRVLSSVQDALHDLDEGDRAMLLARYCDGLDASELGLRLGLPASTVRSRLSRATARVRRSLDERWGDRSAWAPAVLAMPTPRRVGISLTTVSGGLLVSAMMKKIAIVVLVVLAGTAVWLGVRKSDEVSADASTATRDDSGRRAADDGTRADASPPRPGLVLEGRVVTAEGDTPVPRAVVIAVPAAGPAMVSTTPGHATVVPRTLADADGTFRIDGLPEGAYGLTAAAPGHLPVRLTPAEIAGDEPVVLRLPAGGNRVEGTVADITGGPIEGELVRAQARNDVDPGGFGAITDADGRYEISVPDGGYDLIAGGEDYTRQSRWIAVDHGPGRADFVLAPAGSIHGTVVDRETGDPVADAVVSFAYHVRLGGSTSSSSADAEECTRTDAKGRFELRPLEPGEYTLHASAPGLASADEPVVPVAIGEQVTEVKLAIDAAFDATGVVVDASNPARGLAGVEVRAFIGGGLGSFHDVTAEDGSFRLYGLRPGAYMLGFEGAGVIASAMEHSLKVESADVDDARYELSRGVTVSGRVSPAQAGDVRVKGRAETGGFEVMINAQKLKNAKGRIADDGSFSIEGVPPGQWRIAATGDDGPAGALDIDVTADGLADVEVALTPRPRVGGIVQDASGEPIAGVAVRVQSEPDPSAPPGPWRKPKTVASAVSRADGRFDVAGIDPGEYIVAAEDGRRQPVAFVDGTTPRIEPAVDHDVQDLVLRVRLPDGRIEGVVHDGEGVPVADAWVQARGASDHGLRESTMAAVTDSDGRFAIEDLAPRTYRLDVRGPDADAQASLESVELGRDVTITLEQLGQIAGRVVRGGQPVPEFQLEAGLGDERRVIAADGRFVLERVAPGERTISIVCDDGSASAKVSVERGAQASVTLEVGAWGSVQGTLVATDGTPLSGVTVRVDSESGMRGRSEQIVSVLSGSGGVVTDEDGRFSAEGVGAGRVTVGFSVGAYGSLGAETLAGRVASLEPGAHLDLGEIVGLSPLKLPTDDLGNLGLSLETSPKWPVERHAKADAQHLWVTWLEPGGPAERGGLQVGDRIAGLDDLTEAALGVETLSGAFGRARIRAGQRYTVTAERGGQPVTAKLRAVARSK